MHPSRQASPPLRMLLPAPPWLGRSTPQTLHAPLELAAAPRRLLSHLSRQLICQSRTRRRLRQRALLLAEVRRSLFRPVSLFQAPLACTQGRRQSAAAASQAARSRKWPRVEASAQFKLLPCRTLLQRPPTKGTGGGQQPHMQPHQWPRRGSCLQRRVHHPSSPSSWPPWWWMRAAMWRASSR
jgi:hypothetical protein